MSEYIKREDVINAVKQNAGFINQDPYPHDCIIDICNTIPSADVVERQRGLWRHYEGMLTCLRCNAEYYDDIMDYCGGEVPRFCPNCGTIMIGER